ncbi:MAG: hypothetical protein ABIN79_01890 [Marmoricola sp.]
MRLITIILIFLILLAALLAVGLIVSARNRKKDQAGRERAGELRSEAASSASEQREQEARAREVEAEAERVRAEADKLEIRAQEERTSYDMTQAQHEESLRAADRIDPDVDHRSADYEPQLDAGQVDRTNETVEPGGRQSNGAANPVPTGPETIVPEHEHDRRDQL